MPRNGSGTYSLPQAPFVAGTVISSAAVNSDLSDIASALTGSLPRDGQAGMTGSLKLPDGSSAASSLTFSNEPTSGFSRSGTGIISVNILGVQIATITSSGWIGPVQAGVQIGTVADFAGSTAPALWYLCYGQAVSRTTYSALFAVIGTTYGVGDGSTTFNLPDCRGRASYGDDNMGGVAANRITVAGGNYDGTILGNSGGFQNQTLSLSQLPGGIQVTGTVNVASSNGLIVQANGGDVSSFSASSGGGEIWQAWGTGVTVTRVTVSSSGTNTLTSSNTGALSHPILGPSIIFSKIIYAGA